MSGSPTRLLVVVPYWEGDKQKMEQVIKLACDLLDSKSDRAELLFVARFDADFPSPSIQEEAAEKFSKVHLWRCHRRGMGFPSGCNEMALGILDYILTQRDNDLAFTDISTFLILESDCVITRRTWVEEICNAWDSLSGLGKLVAGALQSKEKWGVDIGDHINAVALYDPDILCFLPCLTRCPTNRGWDHHFGPVIMPYAVDSALFKLDYQRQTISEEELYRDASVLIYHGVKDESAINAVRKRNNL